MTDKPFGSDGHPPLAACRVSGCAAWSCSDSGERNGRRSACADLGTDASTCKQARLVRLGITRLCPKRGGRILRQMPNTWPSSCSLKKLWTLHAKVGFASCPPTLTESCGGDCKAAARPTSPPTNLRARKRSKGKVCITATVLHSYRRGLNPSPVYNLYANTTLYGNSC